MPTLHPNALVKSEIRREICDGLVFRASPQQHHYVDKQNRIILEDKVVMRQLRRSSCPGCRHCGYLYEYLNDFSKQGEIQIRPDICVGARYRLEVVDIDRHPETGLVQDWGLAFVKIEEPSNETQRPRTRSSLPHHAAL